MVMELRKERPELIMYNQCSKVLGFRTKNRRMLHFFVFCAISTYLLQGAMFRTLSYVKCRFADGQSHSDKETRRELVQLQVLFRHGHRSPFYIYKTDPNPEEFWTTGLGQLTQLGKVQHFMVGQYLRETYAGFISSNSQEVHCLSSGAKRCLFAAYAHLAGMYPPSRDKLIDGQLSWQPVPVEYNPEHSDLYLQSSPNCPLAEQERKGIFENGEGAEFIAQHKYLYEFWSNKSGEEVNHYDDAGGLFKTLSVEKTYNLTIPDWAQDTWEDLKAQANKCYYFHFKTKLLHRLRAGPLLGRMLKVWRSKVSDLEKTKKVYLYSGHGSNMAAVLQALQIFNAMAPPYSSFITFELYREEEHRHTIRILYSNTSTPEYGLPPPRVMILPNCTEYCPFEFLEMNIKDMVPEDWKAECESNGKKFKRRHSTRKP